MAESTLMKESSPSAERLELSAEGTNGITKFIPSFLLFPSNSSSFFFWEHINQEVWIKYEDRHQKKSRLEKKVMTEIWLFVNFQVSFFNYCIFKEEKTPQERGKGWLYKSLCIFYHNNTELKSKPVTMNQSCTEPNPHGAKCVASFWHVQAVAFIRGWINAVPQGRPNFLHICFYSVFFLLCIRVMNALIIPKQ